MKSKILLLELTAVCVITFCGCSSTQLENTNILTTYFADFSDGKVKLGGGVANVRNLSDAMAENPVSLIYAQADTVANAEEKLKKSADHPLFFGGIRALVVGKDFAQRGIGELCESVKKDYKLRSESMFFVSYGNPENVVCHKAVNDFTGGFAAESMLKSLQNEGRIFCATLADVFEMLSVKKIGLAVACVDVSKETMSFENYAIFDEDKMVKTTTKQVSDGINMFLNNKTEFDFYINDVKYSAVKTKQKKEAFLDGNDLFFDIEFWFKTDCKIDDDVKMEIEEYLLNYANSAFDEARNLGCDFLNLYRVYQKKYRYEFENSCYSEQIKNSGANIRVHLN